MKTALIILENLTQANKAKEQLTKMKISATVEKTTDKNGSCAYGIRVSENPERVCRLLSVVNIKCKAIKN